MELKKGSEADSEMCESQFKLMVFLEVHVVAVVVGLGSVVLQHASDAGVVLISFRDARPKPMRIR